MYPCIKSNAIDELTARAMVGDKAVDTVLSLNCDFTCRVIDESYGVDEMSACVILDDGRNLTILYLVDSDDVAENEDLGNLDYSNYTFTID